VTASLAPLTELAEIDSTNLEAQRRLIAGAPAPFWIRADRQSAGRGRRGRQWVSLPGNLFLSGAFRFGKDQRRLAQLSFAASLAVHDALSVCDPKGALTLKWPNDVLLDGAKISGILLESGEDRIGRWLVIGVGVNIVSSPSGTPYPVTHLQPHVTGGPDAGALGRCVAARMEAWIRDWTEAGFEPVRQAWLARAFGLGEAVEASSGVDRVAGVFEDLDPDGSLVLLTPAGDRVKICAGEAIFSAPRQEA